MERGSSESRVEGYTIVCFANIEWTDLRQRHQILMEGLVGWNRKIYFVESLGVRAPRLSGADLARVLRRVLRVAAGIVPGSRVRRSRRVQPGEGVKVLSPLIAPEEWPMGRILNRTILFSWVLRRLARLARRPTIAWVYLPTRAVAELLDRLDPDYVVYDCTSNYRSHPSAPPSAGDVEDELLARADLVFADAEFLFQRCKAMNPSTVRLPPGVHWEMFGRPASQKDPVPAELTGLARPLALFFGSAKAIHFDWQLVKAVAERLPDWSFVIVGFVEAEVRAGLQSSRNVRFVEVQPHARLPAFLWAADALFLPYRIDEFTRGLFPAKLYECLASGTPIVSTPLAELTSAFSGEVIFAASPDSFSAALEAAVETGADAGTVRMNLARSNSWKARIATVEQHLNRLLGGEKPSSPSARR